MKNSAIVSIYENTKRMVLEERHSRTTVSIFLCGANSSTRGSLRKPLRDEIEQKKSKYTYRVFYPEELFMELLYGHDRRDLLSLENVLASSVDAVAILLEGPGTIAELGAFTNHSKLSNKLIIIANEKFKGASSFINQGPIRHLVRETTSSVIWVPYDQSEIPKIAETVCDSARKLASDHPIPYSIGNPIVSHQFLLALIYILDPIDSEKLIEIVKVNESNFDAIADMIHATLNVLVAKGLICPGPKGFSTTIKGNEYLIASDATKKKSKEFAGFLYSQRILSLSCVLKQRRRFHGPVRS